MSSYNLKPKNLFSKDMPVRPYNIINIKTLEHYASLFSFSKNQLSVIIIDFNFEFLSE